MIAVREATRQYDGVVPCQLRRLVPDQLSLSLEDGGQNVQCIALAVRARKYGDADLHEIKKLCCNAAEIQDIVLHLQRPGPSIGQPMAVFRGSQQLTVAHCDAIERRL